MIIKDISFFNYSFLNKNYKELNFNENQIIYVDPPYLNEVLGTESNYNKESFSIHSMQILIDMLQPYQYIFSHYKNDNILNIINKYPFNIQYVNRKNTVSGHKETRGKIQTEIIVSSI